jgi:hypothetical protein
MLDARVLENASPAAGHARTSDLRRRFQQDRISAGAYTTAQRMRVELGDAVLLTTRLPTSDRTREMQRFEVGALSFGRDVPSRRRLAACVRYNRRFLPDRSDCPSLMPAAALAKVVAIYDDAFWHADVLSAMSVAMHSPIETTLDASSQAAPPGGLAAFAFGPATRSLARLDSQAAECRPRSAVRNVRGEARNAVAHENGIGRAKSGHAVAASQCALGVFTDALGRPRARSLGEARRRQPSHRFAHRAFGGAIRSPPEDCELGPREGEPSNRGVAGSRLNQPLLA